MAEVPGSTSALGQRGRFPMLGWEKASPERQHTLPGQAEPCLLHPVQLRPCGSGCT